MVESVHTAEKALGDISYKIQDKEAVSRLHRRSLYAVKDIKAGEVFTEDNVRSIRPANGLHPRYLKKVLGRKASRNIERGTPLSRDMID
jgi:pseudaminic acid synthase